MFLKKLSQRNDFLKNVTFMSWSAMIKKKKHKNIIDFIL